MAASKIARLLLIVALLGSTTRLAYADDVADEADLQFQLGAERYETGDYKGALEHFLVSNRLVPNKNVLFNIARTYEQLKRAPDAYRYYVVALEGETSPQARKRVEDALARITPNVAILKVETSPPGATVYLDRRDLGPRGNAPRTLGLAEGKRKVIVEKAGYEPAESEELDLKIGKEVTVQLTLKQILGTAKIEGEDGAQVKVDDEGAPVACTVPCSLQVAPGRHTFFVLKEGFQAGEIVAEIPANQVTSVRARLNTQTGAVVVSSDVRDALITIDGTAVGFTPAVLSAPVGKHTITIAQQGYRPFVQVIEVSKKQETKIDAQLVISEEVSAASRTTESVEDAPASVSIISQQELRAMGYPTVAEAVRGIRGLYLSDDRSYQTIGFRGFSRPGDYGNRVLVLLDGQPMNDNYIWSSYVGTDGRTDIDDIERIEVVRGPGSVLYGSSAFFGVINLVTRSRNQPTHAEASVGTFEYGLGKGRATAVVRLSPDAGFWATLSGLQGGAQRDLYYKEYDADPADPNAEKKANGHVSDGVTRGTDRQFAGMFTGRIWWKALTLQWFLNSRKKFLPTGEYGAIFDDPRTRFSDTRGMVEARYEPQVTKSLQSLSRAHFNIYSFDGFSPYQPAEEGPSRDSYRGRWGGIEQRFVYSPSTALRLTVGGEVVQNFTAQQIGVNDAGAYVLDDKGKAGRNDPFTVGAGYVNADYVPLPRLKIVAGARFDYYSNLPKFEALPATNPRLAAIIKPYDGGVLKIMGAKAFRTPSVYELHYTSPFQLAPTKLSPEQIYSGEVELTHRFSQTVTGTIAGYTNYVKDLVVLNEVLPGIVQYQNSPANVIIFGGEAEVRREWRQGWMLAANYSYQKAQYTGGGNLRDVANSIEHIASMRGAMPIIGRSLMGMTRLTIEGPRPDRNEKPTDGPQEKTDTGVVWDLVLSGEVERMGLRYNLGVYNALDWKYSVIPSGEFRQRQIVQNGRTFLASVTLSFSLRLTSMKRSLLLLVPALVLALACNDNAETPALGTVGITTSAPTVEQGFTTTDGWSVTYSKFLVNVSAVTIAGSDQVVTASATGQIVDYAAQPTPKTLVSMTNRVARAWEDVSLEIGPATADSTLIEPATADDQTLMVAGGMSIYVEGTMTKGDAVKSLKWGFAVDTKYLSCKGRLPTSGEEKIPGLIVPANGSDSANVALTGDVLFFDNAATHGHALRGNPIASADADEDGIVTTDELLAVTLDQARTTTSLYQASEGIDNLGDFIADQARNLVASFRDDGDCTIEPVVAAP